MASSAHLNSKHSRLKKSPNSGKASIKKKKFLLRSVPLYVSLLILFIPLLSLGFYFLINQKAHSNTYAKLDKQNIGDTNIKIIRQDNLGLIHPLLYVDIENEKTLIPAKTKINSYLEQKTQEGIITSASVYLKDLNTGSYININPDSLYDPSSLMKVPVLLIYLKQAETNPDLLKKRFLFTRDAKNTTVETIKDKSLVEGKSYTAEDLLYYMIVYSDNEAFWILCNNIENSKFEELDKELAIPLNYDRVNYHEYDKQFIASVNSVAHYFNVLYNATYLNKTMSLYALNLLTKCNFKEGISKGIDSNVIVAHKFGERELFHKIGEKIVKVQTEFHEFGIVYLKNCPYLLGIMTKGSQLNQLKAVAGDISRIVYNEMK